MKFLFLHGLGSTPGGTKPTYLIEKGHEVLNPHLPDADFEECVHVAQAEYDRHRPDVVVSSSRGDAVAINIQTGTTPLVLLCPAWKFWETAKTVKPNTTILHSRADETAPFSHTVSAAYRRSNCAKAIMESSASHSHSSYSIASFDAGGDAAERLSAAIVIV